MSYCRKRGNPKNDIMIATPALLRRDDIVELENDEAARILGKDVPTELQPEPAPVFSPVPSPELNPGQPSTGNTFETQPDPVVETIPEPLAEELPKGKVIKS
jgi:hypothetical protein